MEREHRLRVFRSGNSVAVRLPKTLGLVEGDEVRILAHDDGTFSMWKAEDRKAVFMALYGAMSPGFMAQGRGDIEQEDRDWSSGRPGSQAA